MVLFSAALSMFFKSTTASSKKLDFEKVSIHDLSVPRYYVPPVDVLDTETQRYLPARKLCYQYDHLHPDEKSMTLEQWDDRIKGLPVNIGYRVLSGPLNLRHGYESIEPRDLDLNSKPGVSAARFDTIVQACISVDYRSKLLPLYRECPEGTEQEGRYCVGRATADTIMECPDTYLLNHQGVCIRAESYVRKEAPECPPGKKLQREFDINLGEYLTSCIWTEVMAPVSDEDLGNGRIAITCPEGLKVMSNGMCVLEHKDEPWWTGSCPAKWISHYIDEEGRVFYICHQFKIQKVKHKCEYNQKTLRKFDLFSPRENVFTAIGDSSKYGSNEQAGVNFNRRLTQQDISVTNRYLQEADDGPTTSNTEDENRILDQYAAPLKAEESDNSDSKLAERWHREIEHATMKYGHDFVDITDEVEILKRFSESPKEDFCESKKLFNLGPYCSEGYTLTGFPGSEWCRRLIVTSFRWDCSHIDHAVPISLLELLEEYPDLPLHVAGLFSIVAESIGKDAMTVTDEDFLNHPDPLYLLRDIAQELYYCVLEGDGEETSLSWPTKRQERVIKLVEKKKTRAINKGFLAKEDTNPGS